MECNFKFEVKDKNKRVFSLKHQSSGHSFLGDNNLFKALSLNDISKKFSIAFDNKQYFAEFVKYLYKNNYINNDVINILRSLSKNDWLIHIFDVEFPDIDAQISEEIKKDNMLSELFVELCQIEDAQKKITNIFQNLDKYNISETDLKKHLLLEIYKNWVK